MQMLTRLGALAAEASGAPSHVISMYRAPLAWQEAAVSLCTFNARIKNTDAAFFAPVTGRDSLMDVRGHLLRWAVLECVKQ